MVECHRPFPKLSISAASTVAEKSVVGVTVTSSVHVVH
jgi:hypothetical protein